mmetsp:Transcript_9056/g.26882  ORF Transcript_9056/g.26882 Transcript_9056/m.26882 type:complete len:249 (-) Transcript_9056:3071-3817(-)
MPSTLLSASSRKALTPRGGDEEGDEDGDGEADPLAMLLIRDDGNDTGEDSGGFQSENENPCHKSPAVVTNLGPSSSCCLVRWWLFLLVLMLLLFLSFLSSSLLLLLPLPLSLLPLLVDWRIVTFFLLFFREKALVAAADFRRLLLRVLLLLLLLLLFFLRKRMPRVRRDDHVRGGEDGLPSSGETALADAMLLLLLELEVSRDVREGSSSTSASVYRSYMLRSLPLSVARLPSPSMVGSVSSSMIFCA